MPSYTFHIHKTDHVGDLHVHVFYNENQTRKLLGRYRIPSLEPVFPHRERELNATELDALKEWLTQPSQVKKLQSCLESTVFDMARVVSMAPQFSNIIADEGEVYINIRVPVSRRME